MRVDKQLTNNCCRVCDVNRRRRRCRRRRCERLRAIGDVARQQSATAVATDRIASSLRLRGERAQIGSVFWRSMLADFQL